MWKATSRLLSVLLLLLLLALGWGSWWLFLDGRAPEKRPDLVRLPENSPPAPKGYPTRNALLLSFMLGRVDLLDLENGSTVPESVVERRDVEYGRIGDRALLLDLYTPKATEGSVPGLIFIHGGGWQTGDKSDCKFYAVHFSNLGHVAATIGYRFAQEAPYPAAVADTKCAVRWMRKNAEELGVDANRIAVIGGSAGGYLAMMAGYSSGVPELEGEGGHQGTSSGVKVVVNLYGPTDLTVPLAYNNELTQKFLGALYAEDPDRYASASPLFHLDDSDPPTLTFQGTIDQIVPVSQADALAEKLIELGVPYWYDRLDGWPHAMDIARIPNDRILTVTSAFLDRFLKDGSK